MVSGNNSFIKVQSITKNNAYLVAYVLWDLLLFRFNSLLCIADGLEPNILNHVIKFQQPLARSSMN